MHYQDTGRSDVIDLSKLMRVQLAEYEAFTERQKGSCVIRVIRHWKNLQHVRDHRRSVWDAPTRRRQEN